MVNFEQCIRTKTQSLLRAFENCSPLSLSMTAYSPPRGGRLCKQIPFARSPRISITLGTMF